MKKDAPYTAEYKRGVLAAAEVAATYNGSTTHGFRLDDCIACKLNVVKRSRPRRNHHKIEDPTVAWLRGVATALAEMSRGLLHGSDSVGVRRVASACLLTIAEARRCGAQEYDIKELMKAGVR